MNAVILLALIVAAILVFVAWLDLRRARREYEQAAKDYYERMRSNA